MDIGLFFWMVHQCCPVSMNDRCNKYIFTNFKNRIWFFYYESQFCWQCISAILSQKNIFLNLLFCFNSNALTPNRNIKFPNFQSYWWHIQTILILFAIFFIKINSWINFIDLLLFLKIQILSQIWITKTANCKKFLQ